MTERRAWIVLWLIALVSAVGCAPMHEPSAKAAADAPDAAAYSQQAYPAGAPAPAPAPPPGAASGQKEATTWKRSQLVPNTSELKVGDSETLPLSSMHIQSSVYGFRARVVVDFYFANDTARQLEGTFKMRLPNGASPYFFAFGETKLTATDAVPRTSQKIAQKQGTQPQQILAARAESWEGPKVARMVPREKAALAYGNTVRRAVDPALMEWGGAGVFNARVFPLTPGRQHRIVVAYDMDLTPVGGGYEMALDLPQKVKQLTVDVGVSRPKWSRLSVTPKGTSEVVDGREHHRYAPSQGEVSTVRVRVTPAQKRGLALSGQDPDTGHYFAAAFTPQLAARSASSNDKRAVLLMDTSLSSNPDAFNVWRKLAKTLLTENRNSIQEFAVMFFNIEARWWRQSWTANTAAEVDALLAHVDTLALEGATDLGSALRAGASPSWDTQGSFPMFLLSDGAATWGESDHRALAAGLGQHRLYAFRSGMTGTDVKALDAITRQSGGAVFSVVGESQVKKAATAHRSIPWTLDKVTVDGVDDMLVAGQARTIYPGQRVIIAGRGIANPGAAAVLELSQNGRKKKVRVPLAEALSSPLAARTYGQIAVNHLESLESAAAKQASAHAMHFRVTGKSCSLLMLESEADYLRHNIVPANDAKVVVAEPPAKVAAVVASKQVVVGNPKTELVAWVKKLETMDGVKLKTGSGFHALLNEIPSASYTVPVKPVVVRAPTQSATSKSFLKRLTKRKITYDAIVKEAKRRKKAHGAGDGLKVLSSLVEHNPGDSVLARDVAITAGNDGFPAQAYHLLRRVVASRPFEPQSYHQMAQVLERSGRHDLALVHYELGLRGNFDARFGHYRKIMRYDYVRFLLRIKNGEIETSVKERALKRLAALEKNVAIGADLVVMITWNTDNTDVDLHVVEPSGEECYYRHPKTDAGGQLSDDVTQGYGPEMYVMNKAPLGKYEIFANYYRSDDNRLSARSKVQVTVYERFGTPFQRVIKKSVTLTGSKEKKRVATVRFKGAKLAQ